MIAKLRAALKHLEASELEPALEALLDAWRASGGNPDIADAIDGLSHRITRKLKPITQVGDVSERKSWHAAFKAFRPALMGRMLEALPGGTDRKKRLELLLTLPPDPRVSTFGRAWIVTPPIPSRLQKPFFAALGPLLVHTGDVRNAACLRQLAGFGAAGSQLAAKEVPNLTPKAKSVLASIEAALNVEPRAPHGDPEALFARVYANPADDGARAVLADLLQQQDDPRGEFIALQLARHGGSGAPLAAETHLEQAWGREWLGEIEPAVDKKGVVFERGFVAQCAWKGGAEDAREWSTVTHLDVSATTIQKRSAAPLLLSKHARHIRHVTGLRVEDRNALEMKVKRLPWETVGWGIWGWYPEPAIATLMRGSDGLFDAARSLELKCFVSSGVGAKTADYIALAERWQHIVRLEIECSYEHLVGLVKAVPRLTHVATRTYFDRYSFDRPSKTLRCKLDYIRTAAAPIIASMMSELPLEHVEIVSSLPEMTVAKNVFRKNEAQGMPLDPILVASKARGVSVTVLGQRLG